MIRCTKLLDEFERRQRAAPPNIEDNHRIVAALFEQACAHGIFPLSDPLDGAGVDIRLARALNPRPAAR